MNRFAVPGVIAAVALGAWLRLHGLSAQVVQDDEWHAIHKLMSAGYGEIFRSFGLADHSIPLTLLYKAMAETIGLDEIDMRILQAASGIALIGLCARLAWHATANAATTVLFAFLVAAAPFLVLYSRFARPYAITTLLTALVLAGIWRWRSDRSVATAAGICVLAALSSWLHPLSALFPAAALAFVMAADAASGASDRLRRAGSTLALALAAGAAMVLPLLPPLLHDFDALSAKAGQSVPGAYTLFRMASLFAGGFPDGVTALLMALSAFGAWRFHRRHRELGGYLAFVALAPIVVVMLLRASWAHQGHTFGRYVFIVQLILLFWMAFGAMELLRPLARYGPRLQEGAAAVLAAAYVAANPAVGQVLTLGAWYGNLYHHFDYVYEHNRAARYFANATPPRFYRKLASMPPGSVLVIEAPFTFEAPFNPLAHYALFHRQREIAGFLHDLCLEGPRIGEVPKDPRFRFHAFVYLDDPAAVARTPARYLLLHREYIHGKPFERSDACLKALERLYGEPVDIDEQLAVFDLRPPRAPPKLQ